MKKLAFTLIELLVVIAVIGILSGLIVVSMSGVTNKATIAKSQIFSNSLRNSLMTNLVSEWKLDDVSGTSAIDAWNGVNSGTLFGVSDTTAGYGDTHTSGWMSSGNCVSGTCLKLDGTNDYVSINNSSSLNIGTGDFTITIWVNLLDQPTADNARFFFKVISSPALEGYNFAIYGNTGYVEGYIAENGTSRFVRANKTALENTGWHYLVFSIDRDSATGIKIYVDGSQETYSTQDNPTTISGDITTTAPLVLGRNELSPTNTYVNGKIDELRIYNAAIPTSQIREQYYVGLNNMLNNGSINKEEYQKRIYSFAINY